MKHILELESADLEKLFGEGLELAAGETVILKAGRADLATLKKELPPVLPDGLLLEPIHLLTCLCGRGFTKQGLNRHKESCQAVKDSIKANGNGFLKDRYVCKQHGKSYLSKTALDYHNRHAHKAGGEGYKYKCTDDDCELTFPTPSSRDSHMKDVHGD